MKATLWVFGLIAPFAAAQEPAPTDWPPKVTLGRQPIATPTYLVSPPKLLSIDVGRQLFVDDYLIDSTTLARVHHVPEYHAANPVLKPDKVWDAGGPGLSGILDE